MTWYDTSAARRRVRWPTPQDFNEAIQNPRSSFVDIDLRRGEPDRNELGIPIAVTGNFAAVYRVRTGRDVHAVRCFLRNVQDQQARYELISRHMSAVKLPQAVEFLFVDEGIRVGGVWHPILKMDWVPGVTLAEYVGRHLDDRRVLNRLIERFLELLGDMRSRQIGHGDLQHGNLLVVEGRMGPSLKLIDYDGMWVPALDGRESNEIGHPNYQHPGRTRAQYGQTLDSFSAWVILASLLGLRWDRALWTTVRPRGADDRLLLGKADYLDVTASAGLRRLSQAGDAAVVHVAGTLIALCPPGAQVLGLPAPTEEDVRGGRAVTWLPGTPAPTVARDSSSGPTQHAQTGVREPDAEVASASGLVADGPSGEPASPAPAPVTLIPAPVGATLGSTPATCRPRPRDTGARHAAHDTVAASRGVERGSAAAEAVPGAVAGRRPLAGGDLPAGLGRGHPDRAAAAGWGEPDRLVAQPVRCRSSGPGGGCCRSSSSWPAGTSSGGPARSPVRLGGGRSWVSRWPTRAFSACSS